jgi:hypothetical protein
MKEDAMEKLCKYCGLKVVFDPGRGWVHVYQGELGSIYVQYCRSCGWWGAPYPSLRRCQNCGGELYDHHTAMPI